MFSSDLEWKACWEFFLASTIGIVQNARADFFTIDNLFQVLFDNLTFQTFFFPHQ
jgi:hypothetical protein